MLETQDATVSQIAAGSLAASGVFSSRLGDRLLLWRQARAGGCLPGEGARPGFGPERTGVGDERGDYFGAQFGARPRCENLSSTSSAHTTST